MRPLVFLFITIITFNSFAQKQSYGVEWIKEQNFYLKFGIANDGIYRIDGKTLKNNGINIAQIPARNFQLFYRGQQIPTRKSTPSSFLTEQDYIEFYAKKRTGHPDSLLYYPANSMPHPYYSMFADTSYYYLTFGETEGNIMSNIDMRAETVTPSSLYHIANERYIYTDEFSYNTFTGPVPLFQYSTYDNGEAMTGKRQKKDSIYIVNYKLQRPYLPSSEKAKFIILFNGRSPNQRQIAMSVSSNGLEFLRDSIIINEFDYQRVEKYFSLPPNTTELTISTKSISASTTDFYSISLVEICYPQEIFYTDMSKTYGILPSTNTNSFKVLLPSRENNWRLYDITDDTKPINIIYDIKEELLEAKLPPSQAKRQLFLTQQVNQINVFQKVKFTIFSPHDYNYIILTNERLLAAAQVYETYRKSESGGNFKTKLITTKEVYDLFNYGEHSPLAVVNMVKYFNQSDNNDKFLLLLGKAHSLYDARPRLEELDLVPSIGYPASDNLLTSNFTSTHFSAVPTLLTGRIPAINNEQVLNYLTKIKQYESTPFELWRKNLIHLSGGSNTFEIQTFHELFKPLEQTATESLVTANVKSISKKTPEPIEPAGISDLVNQGIGLISFLGHSSPSATDFNIGNVTDPSLGYNNQKYPLLFFNGCSYTNTFRDIKNSQAIDWLFAPNKGAIGVLGQSYINDLYAINKYMNVFYKLQFQHPTYFAATIGKILQQAAIQIEQANPSFLDNINLQEMILLGDPALRLFPIQKPDYYISKIFVESANSTQPLSEASQWKVGVVIGNKGKIDNKNTTKISIAIEAKTTYDFVINAATTLDTVYFTISNTSFIDKIRVFVDAKKEIDELDETNNISTLDFMRQMLEQTAVFPVNSISDKIPPILSVTINGQTPISEGVYTIGAMLTFTLYDNLPLISSTDTAKVRAVLRPQCSQCGLLPISINLRNAEKANILSWTNTLNITAGKYDLIVQATDLSGNKAYKEPALFTISLQEPTQQIEVIPSPNPFEEYVKLSISRPQNFRGNQCVIEFFDQEGKIIDVLEESLLYNTQTIYWRPTLMATQTIYYRIIFRDTPTPVSIKGKIIKQ